MPVLRLHTTDLSLLENRTSMMVKAIMPVLKDLKLQINKTNKQLASQYRS